MAHHVGCGDGGVEVGPPLGDPVGEIFGTDGFRTGGGYALLQLESSTPPVVKSFEAARDDIAQKVYEGKRNAEFGRYLAKLRSEAIIEWKNEEMHKLWMARTAATAAPSKNPGL